MPNYNNADYIGQAIDSVLNQTLPCDLLVVDDGSTDDSKQIIQSKPIHSIFKKNGGPASARNKGMDWILQNDYQFIILLDSDDFIYPEFHEKTMKHMAKKEVVAVYGDYDILHNVEGHEEFTTREYKRSLDDMGLWRQCLIPHQMLARTSVFAEVKERFGQIYNPELRVCNDYDVDLKINQFGILWHIPEVLGVVREGVNNSCGTIHGKIRDECMNILRQTNAEYYL
jgi:glycosyltransferase involved in cell wall biosynthesis